MHINYKEDNQPTNQLTNYIYMTLESILPNFSHIKYDFWSLTF